MQDAIALESISSVIPEITVRNNHAITTSIAVANFFCKEHKNVLQKIRQLDCSPAFTTANFSAVGITVSAGFDEREIEAYEMTRNGFIFLVMGFTGKKAAAFKEAYIAEFDRMEDELRRPAIPETHQPPSTPLPPELKLCVTLRGDKVTEVEQIDKDMYVGKIEDILSGLRERGWVVIPRDMLFEKLAAL